MREITGAIDEVGQTVLPLPVSGKVCSWVVQFEDNSFTGSVTIKAHVADSSHPSTAVAYKDMTTGENATAAFTGSGLALVDSAGLNIILDCTAASAGSLLFSARPMIG